MLELPAWWGAGPESCGASALKSTLEPGATDSVPQVPVLKAGPQSGAVGRWEGAWWEEVRSLAPCALEHGCGTPVPSTPGRCLLLSQITILGQGIKNFLLLL